LPRESELTNHWDEMVSQTRVAVFADECFVVWGDACGYVWGNHDERGTIPIVPCDRADSLATTDFLQDVRLRFPGTHIFVSQTLSLLFRFTDNLGLLYETILTNRHRGNWSFFAH
jgi:hypothetical protein